MCGILAILNPDFTDIRQGQRIDEAFNEGKSRGPDHSILDAYNGIILGFHRLSINGLSPLSNQPISYQHCILICNGEIYNYKDLHHRINSVPTTNSDCEIIIHLYLKYGIEQTLRLLDSSEFAFVLYDTLHKQIYIARDPYGVRPLYQSVYKYVHSYASEVKMLTNGVITMFPAGHYSQYVWDDEWVHEERVRYTSLPVIHAFEMDYTEVIRSTLTDAVYKRVQCTERPIACLLSGGLDSSLITALVQKCRTQLGHTSKLETYSIGMKGSQDLLYAEKVASFLGTQHTSIVLTEQEFFNAIPEVIYKIESYDTTTVRASVGNYLVCKYISEHSDAKVIFNGDGSDEVTGGYLYLHGCPDEIEFDKECCRLVENIQYFDALRSDKCISSNGLESRTPFLDRAFVQLYLSIPSHIRVPNNKVEKYLLRNSFKGYLPQEVLWRRKEAFSDGVSSENKAWYEVIQELISPNVYESYKNSINSLELLEKHNPPTTVEQYYYRSIFDIHYPNAAEVVPYFWMPKYTKSTDCSARTLECY